MRYELPSAGISTDASRSNHLFSGVSSLMDAELLSYSSSVDVRTARTRRFHPSADAPMYSSNL